MAAWRRFALAAALGLIVTAAVFGLPSDASAQAPASNVTVLINNVKVQGLTEPLKLKADGTQRFKVVVNNTTAGEINISTVSFEGKVVGLPVFRCEGLIALVVPPGATGEQEFDMDPNCLKDQATGLMPARISVYGPGRVLLGSWSITLDISGSLKSIYGLFGLALAAITLLSILGGLIALARHKLSPNRWSRAMRFAIPGIGLGFTIVFGLAAAGVAVPTATMWIPVVGSCFAVLGLFGYFSPRPDEPEDLAIAAAIPAATDTARMPGGAAVTAPMAPVPGTHAAQTQPAPETEAPPMPPLQTPPPAPPPPSQTVRRAPPGEQ